MKNKNYLELTLFLLFLITFIFALFSLRAILNSIAVLIANFPEVNVPELNFFDESVNPMTNMQIKLPIQSLIAEIPMFVITLLISIFSLIFTLKENMKNP
ncbi:hypothetical protein [Vagococcus silagei]|uniref:Uncharacterized protein n=1 Tax=Vagococcus silagei TaxID=2508885 RepID=A0A4S3B151_9ENTE|nr:hypothetical protein [Vagococcus silagei]THB60138.1 hypothetical protein ESZ54_11990 [Vagococcus silagei]